MFNFAFLVEIFQRDNVRTHNYGKRSPEFPNITLICTICIGTFTIKQYQIQKSNDGFLLGVNQTILLLPPLSCIYLSHFKRLTLGVEHEDLRHSKMFRIIKMNFSTNIFHFDSKTLKKIGKDLKF